MSNIALGSTISCKFNTKYNNVLTTLAGSPVISAYLDNNAAQITAGITLTVDFDSLTGMHDVTVVASGGNGFAAGKVYYLVITTGTVGGVSAVGTIIGYFTVEAETINQAGSATINGVVIDTAITAIKAKTDNLPSDPADASDIATQFTNLSAKVDVVDDFLDTEIAAIKAKTDLIPADPADASDVAGLIAGVASQVTTLTTYVDTEVAAIKAKTDNLPAAPANNVDLLAHFVTTDGKIDAVQAAVDVIDDFVDTEVAAIKAKTDNLPADPADASDIAAAFASLSAKVDTIDDFLDTEVAAIKAKTDNLPSDPADQSLIEAAITAATAPLATAAALTIVDDFLDTEITAIKAKTDNLPSDPADQSLVIAATDAIILAIAALNNLSSAQAQTAAAAALNAYDAPTHTEMTTELAALPVSVVVAVFARAFGSNYQSKSFAALVEAMVSVLCGPTANAGTGSEKFKELSGGAVKVTVTNDATDRTATTIA